jgi:undecaprenyl-diphosphatase
MQELLIIILSGFIQGLTEFIPISSTAHLFLFTQGFIGKDIGILATNIISLGTTIALIQYFWTDLTVYVSRILSVITKQDDRTSFIKNISSSHYDTHKFSDITLIGSVLSTIPITFVYLLFSKYVEVYLRSYVFIGFSFIFGATVLWIAEYIYSKKSKENNHFTLLNFFTISVFQILALIPGMSRSGSTLTGGLIGTNVKRVELVKNVFLISVPAFILAGLFSIYKVVKEAKNISLLPSNSIITNSDNTIQFSFFSLVLGGLIAYCVGLYVLKWLIKFLSQADNRIFIIYRFVIGLLLIILFWKV